MDMEEHNPVPVSRGDSPATANANDAADAVFSHDVAPTDWAAKPGSGEGGDGTRRVLFISYAFPPVGGAGVQRVTKFVKYMHRHGWTPSVLTVANPSVPAWDPSLLEDVPEHAMIRRARTLEPGYAVKAAVASERREGPRGIGRVMGLAKGAANRVAKFLLQPDPQVLWLPGALREGKRLLAEAPHAAIVASGPPFSVFLIGAALARHSGLPLILDYRDEWGISNKYLENKQLGPVSRLLQRKLQERLVRRAGALLATTRSSARALEEVRDRARSSAQVMCIYNGYDPDDFAAASSMQQPNGTYRIAYVGTLWNLTSVEPLVEAVRKLSAERPELAKRLELVFAGRRTTTQQELLGQLEKCPCRVVQHAYVEHHEAIDLMRSADEPCILLSDVPGADRVVPAKLFECMAARRPILAIAPRGEMWELLEDYPASFLAEPRDVDGIAVHLAKKIAGEGSGIPAVDGWDAMRHARPTQAGQLAQVLDALAQRAVLKR